MTLEACEGTRIGGLDVLLEQYDCDDRNYSQQKCMTVAKHYSVCATLPIQETSVYKKRPETSFHRQWVVSPIWRTCEWVSK